MTRNELLEEIVAKYFSTRPNLNVRQPDLAVFFFACAGAGKSTIRRFLVDSLRATYVSNDEVRELLTQYPAAEDEGIDIKMVVSEVVTMIRATSPNHFIVYDNSIVNYYMHEDSYFNVARANNSQVFVIGIEANEEQLRARIIARGVNVEQILGTLPGQIIAYQKAVKDVVPDQKLALYFKDEDLKNLATHLEQKRHL